jgi:hypothetical protein
VDEFDNNLGTTMEVYLHEYRITKETPKGCWVEQFLNKPRFVLNDSRKRFACRTVEEARDSFKARKAAYVRILNSRIRVAEQMTRDVDRHFERRQRAGDDKQPGAGNERNY